MISPTEMLITRLTTNYRMEALTSRQWVGTNYVFTETNLLMEEFLM